MTIIDRMRQAVQMARTQGNIHCFVLSHWDMRDLGQRASEWPTVDGLAYSATPSTLDGVPFSANAAAVTGMSFAVISKPGEDYIEIHSI